MPRPAASAAASSRVLALLAAVVLAVPACSASGTSPSAGAPSPAGGPSTGSAPHRLTVPVRILAEADGQAVPLVDVTLPGGTTHVFAVDTGAAATVLDVAAAQAAGLQPIAQTELRGAASAEPAQVVALEQWSLGTTVALPATRALVTDLPDDLHGGVAGLLGGDVLHAFGVVELDYRQGLLLLDQLTGAPAASSSPEG